MPRLSVVLAMLCVPSFLSAQNIHPVTPPEVRAVPLQGVFKLDGKLDDPVWQTLQSAAGDGTVKTFTVQISAASQRFYRLLVE